MPKKKLLAYSIYYWPELASSAQMNTELFEGISQDFEVTVICAVPCYMGNIPPEYQDRRLFFEDHSGVNIVRVPVREFSKEDKLSRILNIIDYWIGARRATRKLNQSFDLVFTLSQPPILGGMLGVYGSKITGAPLVYGIQDFNPEQTMAVQYAGNPFIHKIMMWFDNRSCKKSKCVVVPGRDLVDTLVQRFKGKDVPSCKVINNWTDDESVLPLPKDHPKVAAFREEHDLTDKFVIMNSGNIGLYYDFQNIIKIIAKFKHLDDVAFVFVGDGAIKSELERYANENKLQNVKFIPYQSKEELPYSLNAADVHLVTNAKGIKGVSCPSKAYGIMATNVPMLCILEPGSEIWCVVEESGCGVLVETGNYEAIETAIRKIIEHREDFVEKHATGRKILDEKYSRKAAIDKYHELFERCAAN